MTQQAAFFGLAFFGLMGVMGIGAVVGAVVFSVLAVSDAIRG